jgi:hypothetical protein
MRKSQKRRALISGVFVGVLIPAMWYSIFIFAHEFYTKDLLFSHWGTLIKIIWPSAVMLVAISHLGSAPIIVSISIVLNLILYAGVFYLVGILATRVRRPRPR